jgi:predicted metal-dependent hydrolase
MQELTASIPHQLSRAEVKQRIQKQLGTLRQSEAMLVNVNQTWTGDRMDFTLHAMGQAVSGHLLVDDRAVHLSVALPWLLRALAGTIRQSIERDVRQLLTVSAPEKPTREK